MKLLFDTQVFDWQINGGISRYFVELMNRLEGNPEIEILFSCTHSYNTYLQGTKWLKHKPKFMKTNFKGKLSLVKKVNQVVNRNFSNQLLRQKGQDLFHPTYYDPYFLNQIAEKPFILTVYDLTIEKFNDKTSLTKQVLAWKKELISKAHHIIAISENTKNDIISYYNIEPNKITTIYLAGGFDFDVKNKKLVDEELSTDYILYVGSRSGYKNFDTFLIEISNLLQKYNLKLIVAGGGQLNAAEMVLINSLNINQKVELHPQVSDQQLASLYKEAMVFVFPSLYEGFGIPVLEAMQCGCPTLLSNNSSLPEVGSKAAVYFDPFLKGNLGKKLEEIVLDKSLRDKMRVSGLEQSLKFNWQNTADKHLEVYKKVYQNLKS